ncbi:G-protein coupled receptor 4-like [Gambusia affinis]|uniref:G-protein coupled receptor 4-like n=1 Tax=Gambusia affinis TaxID=33528 RepID=UPI001CDC996D|nr:G-protein coupled receptor 4-like [Gambusia affinis]
MKELNFNDTSFINSFNYSNMTNYSSDPGDIFIPIPDYVNWIIIAIGFPLDIIVLIADFFQMKNGQDAPVYVINLLVSNILQLCCRISELSRDANSNALYFLTYYTILVSVGFMMCVSCERYLVVAKPLWYRFRRTIKTYVVVCMVVWILPVLFPLLIFLAPDFDITVIITVLFILPFPLFIFFLVGTIKALSGAFNVPADEKRRIAAIQVVELIIYTLLYLPIIVSFVTVFVKWYSNFWYTAGFICVFLSPLANTTFYLLSRKSIMDTFLASICSCKISNN